MKSCGCAGTQLFWWCLIPALVRVHRSCKCVAATSLLINKVPEGLSDDGKVSWICTWKYKQGNAMNILASQSIYRLSVHS